ncbi:hypothetical protein [uncultured Sulfitobacter sp.]|uniref:hypothetical protein n=1 Tax=uncultured Sulfitobacter sp. TaxID=191468 RepID=UPI002624F7E4|nr:hypothetical protein [uncultured Sulfitobacter sp.]
MTPKTHGWQIMRDAALSLALTHPFGGDLANSRQMTAFTYSGSPAVLADDPALLLIISGWSRCRSFDAGRGICIFDPARHAHCGAMVQSNCIEDHQRI